VKKRRKEKIWDVYNFITQLLGIKEWYVEVEHIEQTEKGF
jgi:hypothetical protein